MDTSKIPDEINKAQSNVSITIELGDIIELISPANDIMHESTMFIKYIDNNHIQLIQVSTLKEYQLSIDENGFITDESIIQINLLSRSDEKGYVRQNNLLPNTWINIHTYEFELQWLHGESTTEQLSSSPLDRSTNGVD